MTFHVAQYASVLGAVMRPGETALSIPDASYLAGPVVEHFGAVPPRLDDLHAAMSSIAAGAALLGGPGSLAATLRVAIDEKHHGGADGELVVTDQRLVVLDSLIAGAAVVWECPRESVVGARVTGGVAHVGRTAVLFADGSGIALLLGVVRRVGADQFVAELSRHLEVS